MESADEYTRRKSAIEGEWSIYRAGLARGEEEDVVRERFGRRVLEILDIEVPPDYNPLQDGCSDPGGLVL